MILLLALLAAPQDVGQKVAELVRQAEGDEVELRDRALKELEGLGRAAVPAIGAAAAKAEGDLKLSLERVVYRIGRAEKVAALLGETRVTLSMRDRPASEVLAELGRVSGQPLEVIAAGSRRVAAELEGAPFWEALESVSRRSGLKWGFLNDTLIGFEPDFGERVEVPRVRKGDLLFFMPACYEKITETGPRFQIEARLAATRGRRPTLAQIRIDELEDDRGVKLGGAVVFPPVGDPAETRSGEGSPGMLLEQDLEPPGFQPDRKAKKLARLKGSVKATYVLTTRPVLSVLVEELAGSSHRLGDLTLLVGATAPGADSPSMGMTLVGSTWDAAVVNRYLYVVTDGKGGEFVSRGETRLSPSGPPIVVGNGVMALQSILRWNLPKSFVPKSFEVRVPEDAEEVDLPFDFREVPLGGR